MTHGLSQTTYQAYGDGHTLTDLSQFRGAGGADEYHLIIRPTVYGDVRDQLTWLTEAYLATLGALGVRADTAVFRRFFCSDLPNQAHALDACPLAVTGDGCAVSRVGEPPMPPAKVALWAQHVVAPAGHARPIGHRWTTGLTCPSAGDSAAQTRGILEAYVADLHAHGLRLADHVLRTWFFVRDVDANYAGLVAARRAFFAEHGLTADTHYIASTGIEGAAADVAATVSMDAYAIGGVRPEQIRFLSAPEYLCPTHVYGVTFERGVAIDYRDRTQVLISGTASIDAAGHILHAGDVRRQLDQTLINIEALLRQAGATFDDVASFIVYVRDPSDMALVGRMMAERVGAAPVVVVVAPVCRPGWLVEVECQATVAADRPELPAF